MPAIVKYQEWTSGTYSWYSSTNTDTCGEVVNELKDWVTTINSNASQSGKQLVVEKDESSSLSANYFGFVLNCPTQNTAGNLYTAFHTNSATNVAWEAGTGWTNNTNQGGYGDISGILDIDSTVSWLSTVTSNARFLTMKGIVDGEEYFVLAWYLNSSTTYSDSLWIFKDQNGEWCTMMTDGGTMAAVYYDELASTPTWRNATTVSTVTYPTNTTLAPLVFTFSVPSGLTNDTFRAVVAPKSLDFYQYGSTRFFGTYIVPPAAMGLGGDQLICTDNAGFFVRYTPV